MRTSQPSTCPLRATLVMLAACIMLTAACGTGGPPPPIDGPRGKAISSSRATIHKDELVFEMATLDDDMRFGGKQLLSDGTWHEFIGELKADGKIYCNDGKSSWVLERKP